MLVNVEIAKLRAELDQLRVEVQETTAKLRAELDAERRYSQMLREEIRRYKITLHPSLDRPRGKKA